MLCASCRCAALTGRLRTVASSAGLQPRVAVIGGGVAGEQTPSPTACRLLRRPPLRRCVTPGLVAADELLRAGLHVTLYDQGVHTPGGRGASHRLTASGVYDHGAQFIRQHHGDRVGALLQQWVSAGAVSRWNARAGQLDAVSGFTPSSKCTPESRGAHFFSEQLCGPEQPQLLVGTSSLAEHLARPRAGYSLHVNSRVTALHFDAATTGWRVTCARPDGEATGQFDAVVVAAAQAARPTSPGYVALTGDLPGAVLGHWARIAAASYLPVFTAMATLAGSPAFDLAAVTGHPDLWLLARDSSKPGRGRQDGRDVWVAVSSPQFAAAQMATQASAQAGTRSRPSREEQLAASQALWTHACKLLGCTMDDVAVEPSQRWSAGFPAQPLGVPCLSDAESGFAACGDWAHGPGVVSAAISGLSAADAVAARWTS